MPTPVPAVLPEEVFHAVAALIPRLIYIAEKECGIEPIDLLVLWHIRHLGQPDSAGRNVIQRSELTRMLKQKFRLADSDITKMLDELQEREFVERTTITKRELEKLFGIAKGQKRVVILTAVGSNKIEQFKAALIARFGAWMPAAPPGIRYATKKLLPILINCARWLVSRYEPDRSEKLYGSSGKPSDAPAAPGKR